MQVSSNRVILDMCKDTLCFYGFSLLPHVDICHCKSFLHFAMCPPPPFLHATIIKQLGAVFKELRNCKEASRILGRKAEWIPGDLSWFPSNCFTWSRKFNLTFSGRGGGEEGTKERKRTSRDVGIFGL